MRAAESLGGAMRIIWLLGLIAGIYLAFFAAQWGFQAAGLPIDLAAGSGAGQLIKYLIVLVCAYLFTALVWRQSVVEFLLLYVRNWRKTLGGFAFCAGLTLGIALLWYAFVFAAGGARWSSAAWMHTDTRMLLNLFGTGLVAIVLAITEEILFRSLTFKYLLVAPTISVVIRAAIISSIIFALAHHFDDPQEWLDSQTFGLFIGLVLLGGMLALVYYTTNSLACAVGAHSGLIWVALGKKIQIVQMASSGWSISNSFDPRTQPASWILFVLIAVLFWSMRHWTEKKFAIENLDAPEGPTAIAPVLRWPADGRAARVNLLIATIGSAACIVGFLSVQAWIDRTREHANRNYRAAAAEFESALPRAADIRAAAAAAGFRRESYLRYSVDFLRRLPGGQVEIRGWAAYLPNDGTPLILFVVVGKVSALELVTRGGRDDAARAFRLTDAAARDIEFHGEFVCKSGEPFRLVALTSERTYFAQRRPFTCP